MNIRQATPSDQHAWDEYVYQHPKSVPYHLFAWCVAIQKAYKHKNISLIAEEDGQICGVLPLIKFKIPFTRPGLVALPFCDMGALLAKDNSVEVGLLNAALEIASRNGALTIDLRGNITEDTWRYCEYPVLTSSNKVRMILNLPDSSGELWDGFKSKLRSQIRKAGKNGLTFEMANHKVDDFYSIFSQNMRDLGSPVHSRQWIIDVLEGFGKNAHLGLVNYQNMPVGAGIILRVGKKVSIPWASTLRSYNYLGPNMLLYWGFLKHCSDSGCEVFDFGRSTPKEGTYRFKAQWGAIPEELPWHRIYLDGHAKDQTAIPSKNRQRVEAVWKRLPLGVSNFIGPQIRQYISL